jgi:hypothetical protein
MNYLDELTISQLLLAYTTVKIFWVDWYASQSPFMQFTNVWSAAVWFISLPEHYPNWGFCGFSFL